MKRKQVPAVALIALYTLSVVASASAVTFLLAEWLVSNKPVTGILLSETSAELEFGLLNGAGLGVKVEVLCSSIFDGWVGEDGLDWTSELLNLSKELIPNTELSGLPLECTDVKECTNPLVWPDGIPGETLAELLEDTISLFVDLLFNIGLYLECASVVGNIAELCSVAEVAAQLTNEADGTVDVTYSDALQVLAGLKLMSCTSGGAETGEARGLESITSAGGPLEVSSTG